MLKKILTPVLAFLLLSFSKAQNVNLTYRSRLAYPGHSCANICGYVDAKKNEYALVGVSNGMSIVNVTNPDNPVEVVKVPWKVSGNGQEWKEIKVYKNYAYMVSEAGGGVQIVNLSALPSSAITYKHWKPKITVASAGISDTLKTIHALHIDTTKGNIYLYGHNLGNKGVIVASLANPESPVYLGLYNKDYVHDGYVNNDTLYAGRILSGKCEILDFTNKSNPVSLAEFTTPSSFTHNTWPNNNGKTLFTTDEKSNSFLTSYDISDLNNITELDRIQSNPGSKSVVHNTHIMNNFAITSWYRDGITIVDVSRPNNLVQVGNYDTYTQGAGNGFQGCWGVYPYLPSGTIVASNIEDGLYVLSPIYKRACYLEGNVKDAVTNANLNGVTVDVLNLNEDKGLTANLGDYACGSVSAGTYKVQFSKTGYQTRVINNVVLSNGVVTTLNTKLLPVGFDIAEHELSGLTIQLNENPFHEQLQVSYSTNAAHFNVTQKVQLINSLGQVVEEKSLNSPNGVLQLGLELEAGFYFLRFGQQKTIRVIKTN